MQYLSSNFYRYPPDYLTKLCDITKAYTPTVLSPSLVFLLFKNVFATQVLPMITEQPEQLTGVKLHNYQINAINWMVSTEQDSDKCTGIRYSLLQIIIIINCTHRL